MEELKLLTTMAQKKWNESAQLSENSRSTWNYLFSAVASAVCSSLPYSRGARETLDYNFTTKSRLCRSASREDEP